MPSIKRFNILSVIIIYIFLKYIVFRGSRRREIVSFLVELYFFIQVNGKLDVGVQSVTRIIVLSAKHVFEKFECKV